MQLERAFQSGSVSVNVKSRNRLAQCLESSEWLSSLGLHLAFVPQCGFCGGGEIARQNTDSRRADCSSLLDWWAWTLSPRSWLHSVNKCRQDRVPTIPESAGKMHTLSSTLERTTVVQTKASASGWPDLSVPSKTKRTRLGGKNNNESVADR